MNGIPSKIDKYEIKKEIGRGGMAIVYLGYDTVLERNIAVKVLPEYFKHDPEFIKRFKREAISVSKLRHPNIVTVFDADIYEEIPFIAMELLPGGSLEELIKERGKLPAYLVTKLCMEISDALDIAHKNGILHRDIKPSNILFDENKRPVITDFGIAKALTGTKLTTRGQTVGTPEYMAPEIIQGTLETSFDIRSDIYSLGIVMYEMLAGELPFKGDTPLSIAFQQVNKEPSPIRDKNPSVPLSLVHLVEKCLKKKPEDRYQTAEELYRDLSKIINRDEISSSRNESEKILSKFVTSSINKLKGTKEKAVEKESIIPSEFPTKEEKAIQPEETPKSEGRTEKLEGLPSAESLSSEEMTRKIEKEKIEKEKLIEEEGEKKGERKRPVFLKPSIIIPVIVAIIAIPLVFFLIKAKEGKNVSNQNLAYISVISDPLDAEVFMDGTKIGVTPVENYELKAGSHNVVLKKEGYLDKEEGIDVNEGDKKSLSYTLEKIVIEQGEGVPVSITSTPIWPMFRYNALHTGRSPYNTSRNNGILKWKFPTGGQFQAVSSPVIAADGTIYMGSNDYCLYAVHPDGTLKWKYKTGGRVWSSPAIDVDGTIYMGSEDSYLYALNPGGTLKWRYQTGGIVSSAPAIDVDGTIYMGSEDSYLYALNPGGTLKWRYRTGAAIASSPAIASDGTIYVGSRDTYLYALHPDGTMKWKYKTGKEANGSTIAADGTVYAVSSDGCLYALHSDGTLKWKFQTSDMIYNPAGIASDGTIYVGSLDRYFYALYSDGTLRWKCQTGGKIVSSPAIDVDGNIYVGSEDGYLHALNPDGTPRWKCQIGDEIWTAPAIALDGTIYVGSVDGSLYAIGGG